MEIIRIQRRRWLRGEPNSFLLRQKDGKMCCLGFVCKHFGSEDSHIVDIGEPQEIENYNTNQAPDILVYRDEHGNAYNKPVITEMILANDNQAIAEYEREQQLIKLAKQLDIEFIFED